MSTDRLYFRSFIPYEAQVWFFRGMAFVLPVIVFFVARRLARELQGRDRHPLRGTSARIVRRTEAGGFERARASAASED